jgi:hypothetical protein
MFIYCNTKDAPEIVGETICRANFVDDCAKYWRVKDEGGFFTIEINSESRCVAAIYSIGNSVIGVEIDDNCASNVIEPLMKKYGFYNANWLLTKSDT